MTTHTPGPWVVGEGLRGYDFGIVKKIENAEIGIADIPEGVRRGEAEANAVLIAAAPELLAELKTLIAEIVRLHIPVPLARLAMATGIIAKAEGR